MITLPWVDKIREAYNLCVPPNKALYDLYKYGEAEELRIEKDLEEEIEQAYLDMEAQWDELELSPEDFLDDMVECSYYLVSQTGYPLQVYDDVEETEYYE